jgi:hypothetical protein
LTVAISNCGSGLWANDSDRVTKEAGEHKFGTPQRPWLPRYRIIARYDQIDTTLEGS